MSNRRPACGISARTNWILGTTAAKRAVREVRLVIVPMMTIPVRSAMMTHGTPQQTMMAGWTMKQAANRVRANPVAKGTLEAAI